MTKEKPLPDEVQAIGPVTYSFTLFLYVFLTVPILVSMIALWFKELGITVTMLTPLGVS